MTRFSVTFKVVVIFCAAVIEDVDYYFADCQCSYHLGNVANLATL